MVLVALLVVLVAIIVLAFLNRQSAENDLAATLAITPVKRTELATYDYLPAFEAQVENSRNARTWAGITDVAWADQLAAVVATLPPTARLNAVSVAPATPIAPIVSGTTLFSSFDVGMITFSGEVGQPIDTAAVQDAIDALPGFKDTTIDSVSIQEGDTILYWSFSGSARITTNVLSGRTTTEQPITPRDPNNAATDGEG